MKDALWLLLFSSLGTAGLCLLFGEKPRRIPFAVMGGLLACGVYLAIDAIPIQSQNALLSVAFLANCVAAFAVTLYAEVMARVLRAPAVVFLTPSLLVLVPGKGLYETVQFLILADYAASFAALRDALLACIGIAIGILCATVIFNQLRFSSLFTQSKKQA